MKKTNPIDNFEIDKSNLSFIDNDLHRSEYMLATKKGDPRSLLLRLKGICELFLMMEIMRFLK